MDPLASRMGPRAELGGNGLDETLEAAEVLEGGRLLDASRSADTLGDARAAAEERELRAVRMAVLLALGDAEWRILVRPWLDTLDVSGARLLLALLGQQWRRGAIQAQLDSLRTYSN